MPNRWAMKPPGAEKINGISNSQCVLNQIYSTIIHPGVVFAEFQRVFRNMRVASYQRAVVSSNVRHSNVSAVKVDDDFYDHREEGVGGG